MQNHGPFTVGKDARAAVKAAVLLEDVARTVHVARQLGEPIPIAQADVDALYDRYQNVYGQQPATTPSALGAVATAPAPARSGSSPAARASTARTCCDQVADQSPPGLATRSTRPRTSPARVVAKPVLTDAAAIRRVMLEANADDACVGVIAWMHTFSPAKMWITGLDQLRKPLLHLHTQANVELPWSEHRHGLHEPEPGRPRRPRVRLRPDPARPRPRKTVAGHVSDPAVTARVGTWTRAALGRAELSTMRLARFGDNMRNVAVTEGDKVEAELRCGVSVNTYGVNDLVEVVDAVADDGRSTSSSRSTPTSTTCPRAAARRRAARVAALRRADRARPAVVPHRGRLHARSPRTSRTSAGCASCPGLAVQRLMADGYGFGGEGDWKTSVMLAHPQGGRRRPARRHVLHGGLHLPPGARRGADPRRAHARGLPVHRGRPADACEIHPLGIGGREDPVRLVFDAAPGDAVILGTSDLGDRFRFVANAAEVVPRRRAAAAAARSRAPCGSRPRTCTRRPSPG